MVIHVMLHTTLQQVSPAGRTSRVTLSLVEGATLQDVMRALEITVPVSDLVLAVNRKVVDPTTTLRDGDTVDLIPALSGG